MLDDTDKNEIIASALNASTSPDGKLYMYPLVMTAHCMAVNLNAFKDAGADQYLCCWMFQQKAICRTP